MTWIIKLEEVIDGDIISSNDIMTLDRPHALDSLDDLGLHVAEGKALLSELQIRLVARQCELDSAARARCPHCGGRCRSKGYRSRTVDTVFGQVDTTRCRFACTQGCRETVPEALRGRSTPEFVALRAKLVAHLPFRAARAVLEEVLPLERGVSHSTIRRHTFAAASRIEKQIAAEPASSPMATEITLGLDTAHIRATSGTNSRHHAVLVGHGESGDGRVRRFAAIEHDDGGQRERALQAHLDHLGFSSESSTLTVLTDGEDALRNAVRQATGAPITPILDYFHIAMRLQHAKQAAQNLSTRVPRPEQCGLISMSLNRMSAATAS